MSESAGLVLALREMMRIRQGSDRQTFLGFFTSDVPLVYRQYLIEITILNDFIQLLVTDSWREVADNNWAVTINLQIILVGPSGIIWLETVGNELGTCLGLRGL